MKTIIFILITFLSISIAFAQSNEMGFRASEIKWAKQVNPHKFMGNSEGFTADFKGTFLYSSFSNVVNEDLITYSANETSIKTIKADMENATLCIRFNYFFTEADKDILYIYDGPTQQSPLLAILSGRDIEKSIYYSSGNILTLKFVSDRGHEDIGFKASVYALSKDSKMMSKYRNSLSCAGTSATDECSNAPYMCSLNDYCGSTSTMYTAGNTSGLSTFCGSIENNSWLSFIPNSPNVTFSVVSGNCQDNSSGIQVTVYDSPDCSNFTQVSNCGSQGSGPGSFTITNTSPLLVGHLYYIMIDGFGGNICSYTISAISGNVGGVMINSTFPEICPGYTTTLTSSIPSSHYVWMDNFGNVYPDQQSIAVSPTISTTYSLTVDPNSCNSINATRTITVTNTLSTPPIYSPVTICAGQTATLSTVQGSYTYSWSGPATFQSTLQNPVIANFGTANNGIYSLSINIDSNCTSNTGTKNIVGVSIPTVGLNASKNSFCPNEAIIFSASGSSSLNGYAWSWSPSEANVSTQFCVQLPFGGLQCNTNPISTPGMSAGSSATMVPINTASMCVSVTDPNGCKSIDTCITIISNTNCGVITNLVSEPERENMNLFPNPATDNITIHSDQQIQSVELSNITGQVLLNKTISQKECNLQLSDFAEGIYFVKVIYPNSLRVTRKIVISR